jgi:hypothetical protein
MEKTDESLIPKIQEILKCEIIDKDYDKEEFLEFCTLRKENGDDLGNWTVEEITEVVELFKKKVDVLNKERKERMANLKSSHTLTQDDLSVEVDKIKVYVKFKFLNIPISMAHI